ncbi:MAG: hypothetical protein IKT01_00190 [Eubacteriaceae bacterium]|nr:hypothetical protein [Eubacteriaceae bacterium]
MYHYICERSICEAVEASLRALQEYGIDRTRENQDRKDIVKETQLVIDVTEPLSEPAVSKAMPADINMLVQYEDEFLNGSSDDKGWEYTYHALYSPFYPKVLNELKRNLNSRRACIALGQGDINFTPDPPCLQLLMFVQADGALELTCVFRSNDGVKAFAMNICAIAALQRKAAADLGLNVGQLHYIANNFHAYSKDFDLLKTYIATFDKYSDKEHLWRKSYSWAQHEAAEKKYYSAKENK